MAKKILFEKFPDEALQATMLEHLSKMEPKRKPTLKSLMELLRSGIAKAKKNGVQWNDIAAYITETMDQQVTGEAVAQSYMSSEREIKNRGKADFEISYSQLKMRYNMALRLLEEHGINEKNIIDLINEERRKRQEKDKNKTEEQKQTDSEITNGDSGNNNVDQGDIQKSNKNKDIFNKGD